MFTGIVRDKGEITGLEQSGGMLRARIRTGLDLAVAEIGASICCDGCCLTVVEKNGDVFTVEISAETVDKTTLGRWAQGTRINLEPSLRLGDEMGGHIVTGHVDGTAVLESLCPDGGSHRLVFCAPDALAPFIAPKGSVALAGISLTVNDVDGALFGVNIIPHTLAVTTFGALAIGDAVNLEIDILARYVARWNGAAA